MNQEEEEEDEIWVLGFEKEEDNDMDQFELFIILERLLVLLFVNVTQNVPRQHPNGPNQHLNRPH